MTTASAALQYAAELLDPTPSIYWNDPVAWVHDKIDWTRTAVRLAPYQEAILADIPTSKRVAVTGPHGLGKTATAALLTLWFADTRDGLDWKMPTTASNWRQLERFLWPEIHKWVRLINWDKMTRRPFRAGTELQLLSLKLSTGSAFAMASDDPGAIEGAHADHLFFVFDEAKAISPKFFDAVEGAFSNAGPETNTEAFALAISTPGETSGRFHEIMSRKKGTEDWKTRHVSLDEAVAAGRVAKTWADQRAAQWGVNSAVYQNRVLGLFASQDEDSVIPLGWLQTSNEGWEDFMERVADGRARLQPLTAVGVDVARKGEALTVMALRHYNVVAELRDSHLEGTTETTGRVVGILSANLPSGYAAVDVVGVGGGVVDELREQGWPVFAFNAAGKTEQTDITGELGFINQRSAGWWTLRELLDPRNNFNLLLPPDDRLIGDLTSPHWKVISGGKIQVEAKDDIIKRLDRSTDFGDAVVMSVALIPEVDSEEMVVYDHPVEISPF